MKIFESFKESFIYDFSKSRNMILVGLKTNLLNDMKERYHFKEDGDRIHFFDAKRQHFGTLFDVGTNYQQLRHDGRLDTYGWLKNI